MPPRHPARIPALVLALALASISHACSDASAPSGLLEEQGAALGIDFVHRSGAEGEYWVPEMMGGGVAMLDFDNDDDLDLFFVQGGSFHDDAEPWRDALYRNELTADGTGLRFTRVEGAQPPAGAYGMGVATGDYDGDGWMDLYITRYGSNQLLRNRGDGSFVDVTAEAGVDDPRWSVAASFFDYDADGDLDLYVGNFLDFRLDGHAPCVAAAGWPDYCGPLAYRAVADRLFRNRGDGTFEDVSMASGVGRAETNSLGVVARDFDADGDLDLYVANDSQANTLWINRGDGTFEDRAVLAGCAVNQAGDAEASMGIGTGDYDNDGDTDLFLAHLDGESNTLYELEGDGFCRDATGALGLATPSLKATAFGTAMVDLDLDGRLDIVLANGAINVIEEQLRAGSSMPLAQADQVFMNRGDAGFEEPAALPAALSGAHTSRGLAVGDLDNDGRPDLVITRVGGAPAVLLNRRDTDQHWLGLDIRRGEDSMAPHALGATVTIQHASGARRATVATDGSYISAHDPRILLGLGRDATSVTLEARLPDGLSGTWTDLDVDRYHRLHLAPLASTRPDAVPAGDD